MRKPPTPEALRLKMADLCMRSEQCSGDIRKKLMRHISDAEADKIIDFLEREKFIDDVRYAKAFVHDKVNFNAWGSRKIKLALIEKRVESSVIAEAIEQIDTKAYNRACLRCAATKAKHLDLNDFNDRQRLYRFIMSRGFESGLASRVIDYLRRHTSAPKE